MSDESPKNASLDEINNLLTLHAHDPIDTNPPDVISIGRKKQRRVAVDIQEVKLSVARWLRKNDLKACPASGLFLREHVKGREGNNYTPDYVWANMDVEGEFVDFEGLNEQRFMTILSQMFESARNLAIDELKAKLAPINLTPNMDQAYATARSVLRYYCASDTSDDEDILHYSSLMLVHMLWLVKRKLFGLPDYFPTMLTLWSKAEGSNKSGFLNALFAPLGAFKEHSTFRIFKDTFGCAPFGQYYALVFPEMRGVKGTAIEALKEILEQDQFVDRDMYTKLSCKTKRRATCFNTSNHEPPHGLAIEGAGRRFYSIHFCEIERQPEQIESFLGYIKSIALELWQSVDVYAKPMISGDDFKEIRAQQRQINRTENVMDEFLEQHCRELDEPVSGAQGIPLLTFKERFKQFLIESHYPMRGAVTQSKVRALLEACGGRVKRKSSSEKALTITSHAFLS